MSHTDILVRDRITGALFARAADEPIKVRVCRSCRHVHGAPAIEAA